MDAKRIYFKSDFDLTMQNAFDWTKPFKARLFTTASRNAKVVRFDGFRYHDCELTQEGKLHIVFEKFCQFYGQGLGTLKVRVIYQEPDARFKDCVFGRVMDVQNVQILDDGGNLVEVKLSLESDQDAPGVVAQLVTAE